jgi:putative transposase
VTESLYPEAPTQEVIRTDLQSVFRAAVEFTLEAVLEQHIREIVGADKWKRAQKGRRATRNGTYLRRLLTSVGLLNVAVPRTRENGSACDVIGRYERRSDEINDAIVSAYVHGVSTRNMRKVTDALIGEDVSRSTVSRVTKTLEEQVEALRSSAIADPIVYLYLDATFLDARWARTVENVSALVAYGVDHTGHRRLLGVTVGPEESEASWAELLEQLLDRGLKGVKLVIADAHAGLAKAVRRFLPEARQQRCVVHLQRNVFTKAPRRLRKRLAASIREIFRAPSLKDAQKRLDELAQGLGRQVPEAMAVLVDGFQAATQFYAFPRAHWTALRTSNGIERLHAEIKRRIRSVGAFPDRASALRLVTAVALEVAAQWRRQRYVGMSEEVQAELAKVA